MVVDAIGDGDGQRREHALRGEPAEGLGLDVAQVLAAVVEVRVELEAVELEVDLDAATQPSQGRHEPVVLGDPDAVRVEDDPRDVALRGRLDDLEDLGVDRRLAARQHQDVDPAALALDRRVERRRRCGSRANRPMPGAAAAKQVGHSRLQFSVMSSSRTQECWVWRSPRPSA